MSLSEDSVTAYSYIFSLEATIPLPATCDETTLLAGPIFNSVFLTATYNTETLYIVGTTYPTISFSQPAFNTGVADNCGIEIEMQITNINDPDGIWVETASTQLDMVDPSTEVDSAYSFSFTLEGVL